MILLSALVFWVPIDCSKGHGCPDWALRDYIYWGELFDKDPYRWRSCDDEYPVRNEPVEIILNDIVYRAIYISRCEIWTLERGDDWVMKDQVNLWRRIDFRTEEEED